MKIKHIQGLTIITNEREREIVIRQQSQEVNQGKVMPFQELETKLMKSIEIITPIPQEQ